MAGKGIWVFVRFQKQHAQPRRHLPLSHHPPPTHTHGTRVRTDGSGRSLAASASADAHMMSDDLAESGGWRAKPMRRVTSPSALSSRSCLVRQYSVSRCCPSSCCFRPSCRCTSKKAFRDVCVRARVCACAQPGSCRPAAWQ